MEKYRKSSPRVSPRSSPRSSPRTMNKKKMQEIYKDFMMRDEERKMEKKNPSFEKMLKASKKKLDQYRKNLPKMTASPRAAPRAAPRTSPRAVPRTSPRAVQRSSPRTVARQPVPRQPVSVAKKLSMYFK